MTVRLRSLGSLPADPCPDAPLRLDIAAALAYPDGSMTASGLRKEAVRGRLVIERTAGKDYTTLHAIEKMRELCRVQQKASVSGSGRERRAAHHPGSSETESTGKALGAAKMIVERLKSSSRTTSSPAALPLETATVLPMKSR